MSSTSLNISYGSFQFPDPVPFVEKEQMPINYGGLWSQKTQIKLNGVVTGLSFNDIISAQENIVSNLSKDYQTLIIDAKNFGIAKVNGINFSDSVYVGVVNYDIEFECYEQPLFNGTFGVVEPKNEYSFQENQDNTISVTHSISAKGFPTTATTSTSNNALENAKNFVQNLAGYDPNAGGLKPYLIKNNITYNPILVESTESIDRINSIYSLEEKYLIDLNSADPTISADARFLTRYTVNINEDAENDFRTVSIDGEVSAGLLNNAVTIADIREYVANINLKGVCEEVSSLTLNLKPENLNFSEDKQSKRITFSAEFNTNALDAGNADSDPYFDYGINVNYDIINNLTTFAINGTLRCAGGNLKERYKRVLDYYDNTINSTATRGTEDYLYNLVNTFYGQVKSSLGLPSNYLNNTTSNLSVIRSPYAGEVSISADFQDNKGLVNNSDTILIKDIKYSIQVSPVLDIFRPNATYDVNGKYLIYELGKSRKLEKINISINIIFNRGVNMTKAKQLAKAYFDLIRSNYSYSSHIIDNENMDFVKYETSSDIRDMSYTINLVKLSSLSEVSFIPGKIQES